MDNTHLDPTRASPPRPPGDRSTEAGKGSGSTPAARDARSESGEVRALGDYRILRRLGEGGMGAVYLSYDGKNDRQVALKVLNDGLVSNQMYIDRFYREARSGAMLNHPNLVRTFSVGQDRLTQKHYLVLEYVDGPSAHALLTKQGRLSVGDAVHIALDVARALEHAHSRNIVHRDIKPDNILITRAGVCKLGDLGLAKRIDEASHLTAARQGFGTTAYMPYEQAINAKYADGRSDIYALGATLYHLLTGQVPFPAENHLEVVEKKNQGYYRPASVLNADVPAALDVILGRMLARHPRDRYQTASELIIDLERSRLSSQLPSFADPELAKQDPWMQACLSTGEPTRLDPESTPMPVDRDDEEWIVHYKNRAGRPFASRLTAGEIIERLQEGTLPAEAQVRRPAEEALVPLTECPVFREYVPAAKTRPPVGTPTPVDPPPASRPWWRPWVLVVGAVAGLGAVAGVVSWLFTA